MYSYSDYLITRFHQLPPSVEWTYLNSFHVACAYVAAGISVVPIAGNGKKQPDGRVLPLRERGVGMPPKPSWKAYQSRVPTHEELWSWFDETGWSRGIGAVCGVVSGGLEMIDIDSTRLVEPWLRRIESVAPMLLPRLVLCRTPRPGLHAYFRSDYVQKSQDLVGSTEETRPGVIEWKKLIETRGEGSYGIVPPSAAGCHPSHRSYLPLGDRTLDMVETLSQGERSLLFEVSREFGHARPTRQVRGPESSGRRHAPHGDRPGDQFNQRAGWPELLQKHGWSFSHTDGIEQYWRRPGKLDGHSASLGHQGSDKLYVFSSNAQPLELHQAYTKFEFVTQYEFAGDFRKAARELGMRGYGGRKVERLASGSRLRRRR